ncbi:hypothetical protein ACF1G0_23220 [Streptomyces sp. NPDC013953]|uniref:hypothetical protein n=1 Tax=Streptomyces sp. NPDC013953 TaxID=3364868 RepID=UPI0036FAC12E
MSEPTVSDQRDAPAVALGPIALLLGAFSAIGVWTPGLTLYTLPWAALAGALAMTSGAAGIHYARRGIGRLVTAVAGTALGSLGFGGVIALLWAFGA